MTGNRALLIAITVILLAALITGITLMGVYIRLLPRRITITCGRR